MRDGAGLLLQRILLPQDVDRVVDDADLLEQIGGAVLLIGQVVDLRRALRADLERIDVWSRGVPSGRVIDCTWAMPSVWKTALATRSSRIMSVGLRRSWSVSIISSSGFSRAFE